MSSNLNRTLQFKKSAASSRRGVVAAQNQKAADIGAEVLRNGGNAIDAAVATSFALGVLEPWMSGIGGIGYLQVWDAKKKKAHVINFSAVSAAKLDPADYPLQGDFLAQAKRKGGVPGIPWQWALGWHSFIHAAGVMLITGTVAAGLVELVAHAAIDYNKCQGRYGFSVDQTLHVLTKVVIVAGHTGGYL